MKFVNYLGDKNVATLMLLFARLSGLVVFSLFFLHNSIPTVVKTTVIFFLTVFLYPSTKIEVLYLDSFFILQLLSEMLFDMIAGLIVRFIFVIVIMAGEQITFTMGFTMASVLDPSSGINMPVTSQILNLLTLLFFLTSDGYHLMLLFLSQSLTCINLGGFCPSENFMQYLNSGMLSMFVIGLTMAFPILAISLLADVIFGILMRTMPQFNLLVIGYPTKIALVFVVLVAILLIMMEYFRELIAEVSSSMQTLFFT